jgi:hypothetical protein
MEGRPLWRKALCAIELDLQDRNWAGSKTAEIILGVHLDRVHISNKILGEFLATGFLNSAKDELYLLLRIWVQRPGGSQIAVFY